MNAVLASDHRLAPAAGARAWTDNEPLDDGPWLTVVDVADVGALPLDQAAQAWRVEPTLQWDYERTWPDGEPSPGIKRISVIRRAHGIDRAAFAHHWRTVHGPLARVHHPAVVRYCQNVIVEPLVDAVGDAGDYDGVAELSFWSADDLDRHMYDSEEGQQIVANDVKRFIDVPRGWRVLTREHVMIGR